MTKKRYYIAYGSNLSVEQMAIRCPDAKIAGMAALKDWKLVGLTVDVGDFGAIKKVKPELL